MQDIKIWPYELEFDYTNWFKHEPESILENEMYKILWDFVIQTDHLIPARRPDFVSIHPKKRTCNLVDFAVPAWEKDWRDWKSEEDRDHPDHIIDKIN